MILKKIDEWLDIKPAWTIRRIIVVYVLTIFITSLIETIIKVVLNK